MWVERVPAGCSQHTKRSELHWLAASLWLVTATLLAPGAGEFSGILQMKQRWDTRFDVGIRESDIASELRSVRRPLA